MSWAVGIATDNCKSSENNWSESKAENNIQSFQFKKNLFALHINPLLKDIRKCNLKQILKRNPVIIVFVK